MENPYFSTGLGIVQKRIMVDTGAYVLVSIIFLLLVCGFSFGKTICLRNREAEKAPDYPVLMGTPILFCVTWLARLLGGAMRVPCPI